MVFRYSYEIHMTFILCKFIWYSCSIRLAGQTTGPFHLHSLRQRARVRALKHAAVASSQGQLGGKGGKSGKGGMNWAALSFSAGIGGEQRHTPPR